MPPPAVNTDLLKGRTPSSLVQRQDLDVKTPGKAVVVKVLGSDTILATYTGVDNGTGDVSFSLQRVTSVTPGEYNKFRVDSYGRITQAWLEDYSSGGGGSIIVGAINNQYVSAQNASYWISGRARVDGDATFLNAAISGTLDVNQILLHSPLSVANGGTGVSTTQVGFVFAGPTVGIGSPVFRALTQNDLPAITFSKLTNTPTTLAGYGIVDAWTKSESDARYPNSASFEPVIPTGTSLQYIRGNKLLGDLITDNVIETSNAVNLYFTMSRTRLSISAAGPNLSYNALSGQFSFSDTPGFSKVTVSLAPTAPTDVANKQYVDTKIAEIGQASFANENFNVVDGSIHTFQLSNLPVANSLKVSLNGLENHEGTANDYIVAGSIVTFTAHAVLTPGDIVTARYTY
jgi:hypothetical protein